MAHFTINLDPFNGPVLDAVIAVSQARAEALREAGKNVPPAHKVRGLLDTGASTTCVDPWVLNDLGLSPTGSILVHTPTSGHDGESKDQYDVGLLIPGAKSEHPPLVRRTIPVIASDLSVAQGIDALIGRDVLRDCVLIHNGSLNASTLAF